MHTFVSVMLMVRAIGLSEVRTGVETHSEKANIVLLALLLFFLLFIFFGLCIKMRLGPMRILNISESALPFISRNK